MSTDPATGQEQTPLDPSRVVSGYHLGNIRRALDEHPDMYDGVHQALLTECDRLAADLAAARERERRVLDLCRDESARSLNLLDNGHGDMRYEHGRQAAYGDVLAVLAGESATPNDRQLAPRVGGEGAADQPQGEDCWPGFDR